MRRPLFSSATQFLVVTMLVTASAPAQGDWTNLDHFNYMAIGSALDGQDDWSAPGHGTSGSGTIAPAVRGIVEDPAEANHPVLEYSYDGEGTGSVPDQIWKPLGVSTIADATTGTMYMRFYVPDYDTLDGDSGTFPDIVFSLRPGPVESSGSRPMGPHMRIQGVDNDDTAVMSVWPRQHVAGDVNETPDWISLDAPKLDTDTWYDLWFVTNNTTDSFELYIQGGSFGSQTQLSYDDNGSPVTDIEYRDLETVGGAVDLDHIWLRAGGNHDGGRMLVDHIHMDSGENLTVPADLPFTSMSLTIDRISGEVRLINAATATADSAIRGYSITSTTGALDTDGWKPIAGNYDASNTGDGSVDDDGNWTVLSDSESHTDLSEYQFGGDGGLIAIDDDVLLSQGGGAWIATPDESGLAMELVMADGVRVRVPILFVGNDGQPLKRSDLDHDGNVTGSDWLLFVDSHLVDLSGLTEAQQYVAGDLDDDGDNDVQDFLIFQSDYELANGAGSFALMLQSIPEPSSVVLCILGGVGFLVMRRQPRVTRRRSALLLGCVACCFAWSMAPRMSMAAISYTGGEIYENFNTLPDSDQSNFFGAPNAQATVPGTSGWEGTQLGGSGSTMDLDSVTTSSTSGTGAVISAGAGGERALGLLTSGSFTPAVGVEIVNDSGVPLASATISFTQELWRTPGFGAGDMNGTVNTIPASWGTTDSGVGSSDFLSTSSGFTAVTDLDLVSPAPDPADALAAYVDGNDEANQASRSTTIVFSTPLDVGESFFLRFQDTNDDGVDAALAIDQFSFTTTAVPGTVLRATLNFATGEIVLRNDSGNPIAIDRYQLDSDSDAFRTDDEYWNSLNDQNLDQVNGGDDPGETWDEAGGASPSVLAELFLIGSTTLNDGGSISLGEAFDPAVGGSVALEYHDKGSGNLVTGEVVVLGDMDGNGDLDEADVPLFVQALVDRSTYNLAHPFVDADMFGDFDGNGLLDVGDIGAFSLAVVNATAASSGATAVPEPTSALLCMFATCAIFQTRCRRRVASRLSTANDGRPTTNR